MTKIINRSILFFTGLVLVACGGAVGTLKVQKSFQLIDRKGNEYQVQEGQQEVTFKFNEKKQRLTIEFADDTKVEMKTPEGFEIPENGDFELLGQDSGQMVDVLGQVETLRKKSPERSTREQCTYTDYETVCSTGPQGQPVCNTRPIQKWGWQTIRYYEIETQQKVWAEFQNQNLNYANFFSNNIWTDRRETYRSQCNWF